MTRCRIEVPRAECRANASLLEQRCHHERLSTQQTAYVLATAFHETRLGLWMVDGADPKATEPLDGLRYRGRGFARLTGRRAYGRFGRELGIPLLDRPELAAEPDVAAAILVEGMRRGLFTGRRLDDFLDLHRVDYVGARQVMSPADRPVRVAGYARAFEARLDGVPLDGPTQRDVRNAQRQLVAIGWPLAVDGVLGRYTRRAINDFQAGYCHLQLDPDGRLDERTRMAIEACANDGGFASDHFRFIEFRAPEPVELDETNRAIRVDRELVLGLERYRRAVAGPVSIECGYRSPARSRPTIDRPQAEHLAGRAVHIRQPQLPVEAVSELGAFSSIGHRRGVAVHVGVAPVQATAQSRVYPLDGRCVAWASQPPSCGPGDDANDPGGLLADAGHRGRPVLVC